MREGRKLVGVIREGKGESENSDIMEAKEGKNIKNGSHRSSCHGSVVNKSNWEP